MSPKLLIAWVIVIIAASAVIVATLKDEEGRFALTYLAIVVAVMWAIGTIVHSL